MQNRHTPPSPLQLSSPTPPPPSLPGMGGGGKSPRNVFRVYLEGTCLGSIRSALGESQQHSMFKVLLGVFSVVFAVCSNDPLEVFPCDSRNVFRGYAQQNLEWVSREKRIRFQVWLRLVVGEAWGSFQGVVTSDLWEEKWVLTEEQSCGRVSAVGFEFHRKRKCLQKRRDRKLTPRVD